MPVRRRRYGPLYADRTRIVAREHDRRRDSDDDRDDDDDDSDFPHFPPFPAVVTVTSVVTAIPTFPTITADISKVKQFPQTTSDSVVTKTAIIYQTITPTVTAFAAEEASPTTIIVQSTPDGPPPPRKGGLSEGTEHLLIAAGSIGATIIIVLIIYGLYMMRKRDMSFADLLARRSPSDENYNSMPNQDSGPPPYQYQDSIKSMPLEPQPAVLSRQPTAASQRPLIERTPTNRTERSALRINTTNNSNNERTFYNDTSPAQRYAPNHMRNISETPSSPVLPLQQTGRQTPSTPSTRRNTRDFDPYTGQPMEQTRSPPTFRQFLANRRISIAPKISRFSWNTSNAPQTPRDDLRMSVGTNRSSVPRFRTIDSWVGQQTNRVQGYISEHDEMEQRNMRGHSMFPVPDVPKEYMQEPAAPAPLRINRQPSKKHPQPLLPDPDEDEGSAIPDHIRRDTVGAQSDATVFRVHPGTEVVIPRGSLVPSEVLNAKVKPLAL